VCEQIVKSSQRINISTDKKRYGKIVTLVSGFDKSVDMKKTTKALKNELACGGTFRNDVIEIQGDHTSRINKALIKIGFDAESIV